MAASWARRGPAIHSRVVPSPPAGLDVAPGRAVCVRYRYALNGGIVVDAPKEPLWFVHGKPGFPEKAQRALLGKRAGDRIELELAPADLTGVRSEALVAALPRSALKTAEPLEVGMRIAGRPPGATAPTHGRVTALTAETVTIDFNPLLAGLTLFAVVQIEAVALAIPARK
jgi:FKBP-type peptidyl-prolyl cis-trans isomerase SlyD